MKKILFLSLLFSLVFVPALLFAAPDKPIDNPYSVNDPMRNFFYNLTDRQKVAVLFWQGKTDAKKTAGAADSKLSESLSNSNKQMSTISAVVAARGQIDAAAKVKGSSIIAGYIPAAEADDLERAKEDILAGLIAKARVYLQDSSDSAEFHAKLAQENDGIGKSFDKIKDYLGKNQLGFDKNGYFVKYDSGGTAIELEIPDAYMKQAGDVYREVPFFSQAPGGGWSDTCQAAACEEASLAQAHLWIDNVYYKDPYGIYNDEDMLQRYGIRQILAMCDYQYENNTSHLYHDSGMADTISLWQDFYQSRAKIIANPTLTEMKGGLKAGHIYVVPIEGPKILTTPIPYKNPAAIPAHSILLVGYNDKRNEFIVNDPGTIRGKGWRFNQADLMAAIRDYPSGNEEKITTAEKRVIELPIKAN